jgi:ferric-chelate reductase
VTCLCDPEAVPDIPNSVVTIERPSARGMVERFVRGATAGSSADTGADGEKGTMGAVGTMGGRTIGAEDVDVDMVEVERLPPPAPTTNEKIDAGLPAASASTAQGCKAQGGVAVCVAGPASLAREVSNAVALVGTTAGFGAGGIGLHAEVYAL